MQIKDSNVFMVFGYTGPVPTLESAFVGQILATDEQDAKASMRELIGDLTVTGSSSLAEMRQLVSMMEKVKSGEIAAPVSEALAIENN